MTAGERPLDLHRIDLNGHHLIEASAGTGKTWTLTGLYLRLLLEAEVEVEEILVVTFTEAATEELRDRLRTRLVDAFLAFCHQPSDDPFIQQLVESHALKIETAQKKLLRAIRSFDNAPVYTIHGFCRRLLNETALEAAIPFDNELIKDDSELRQGAVDDFWRRNLHEGGDRPQAWTPETLSKQLQPWLGKSYLPRLGCQPELDLAQAELELSEAFNRVASGWEQERCRIIDLLKQHPTLNRRVYSKKNLPNWLDALEFAIQEGDPQHPPEVLARFTHAELAAKSQGQPPVHDWFEKTQRWLESHQQWLKAREGSMAAWRCRALTEVGQILTVTKRRQGVLTFDDLLLELDRALHQGPAAQSLAEWARRRFPVALIDEFQDTDPIQYRIFRTLYQGHRRPLFYVGDPKQAIYSFRGADLYAYLQAQGEIDNRHTLKVNWRSSRALVRALNCLFSVQSLPFRHPRVPYVEVEAAAEGNPPPAGLAPLRIWTLVSEQKPIGKGRANDRIVAAVADEIASLLAKGEVKGSDIAVLVRKNAQADRIRRALAERGVASVQQTSASVFSTEEAEALLRVLEAVAWVNDEARLRAALVTDLIGLNGDDLMALDNDPGAWDDWVERFDQWQLQWQQQGLMAMLRAILQDNRVYGRFLQNLDGERRLTDLLHVAELLQRQHMQQSWGMEGLIKWFQWLVAGEAKLPDDAELRLESDADLVQIVTIHRSKGLEYNLVYCPFLWDGGSNPIEPPFLFHDPGQQDQACLELGSSRWQANAKLAAAEQQAEELRLAYVAMTRAKSHCTVISGWIKGLADSPLGWLLHGEKIKSEKFSRAAMEADLASLASASGGTIQCQPVPENGSAIRIQQDPPAAMPPPRRFSGILPVPWRVTSYTGLIAGRFEERPDYDQTLQVPEAGTEPLFPTGAQAGICLHAILERLEFTRPVADQWQTVVGPCLARSGFHQLAAEPLCAWLQGILDTPLNDDRSCHLRDLKAADRINEMEFYLPLTNFSVARLLPLLGKYESFQPFQQACRRLQDQTIAGYLKGFVDLVFHWQGRYWLADYKSNRLGEQPGDYTRQAMTAAVAEEHYYLQYLLYTLALHRFLKLRLPDYEYAEHFGGVYYLFLRGMTPPTGNAAGVYFDRPSVELVEELGQWFRP